MSQKPINVAYLISLTGSHTIYKCIISYVCWLLWCSGVSLQHSQSASPYDTQVYNENLGLSVEHDRQQPQTTEVPEHHLTDRAWQHQHVPMPPPAYDGAVPARSRPRNHHLLAENGAAGTQPSGDEKRSVYAGDHQKTSASPNVSASAQFTSDISLASSNVTSYEDNGRQPKVCLSTVCGSGHEPV